MLKQIPNGQPKGAGEKPQPADVDQVPSLNTSAQVRASVDLNVDFKTHYATQFTICLSEGVSPWEIYRLVRNWVAPRARDLGYELSKEEFRHFLSGISTDPHYRAVSVRTQSLYLPGDEYPRYWVLELNHKGNNRGDDSTFRQWRVEIGLTALAADQYAFSLIVKHRLDPSYVGPQVANPMPSIPRIVKDLVRMGPETGKWTATSGSTILREWPLEVSHSNASELIDCINDKSRNLAVAFVSAVGERPSESGDPIRYLVDPNALARDLIGTAIVYVSTAPDLHRGILDFGLMAPEMLAWNGSAAIYFPPAQGLTRNGYPCRYRILKPESISETGESFAAQIIPAALRHAANLGNRSGGSSGPVIVRSLSELDAMKRQLDLQFLFKRIKEAKANPPVNTDELEQLRAGYKDLQDYVTLQSEEIDNLSKRAESAEQRARDLSTALEIQEADLLGQKAKNAALQVALQRKGGGSDQPAVFEAPQTVSDALEQLEARFPERVVVLAEARKGASRLTLQGAYLDKALQLLDHIPQTLWQQKFGEGGPGKIVPREFTCECGFEIALSETTAVKNSPVKRREREVVYKGEVHFAEIHIKAGTDPGREIRVHLLVDEADRKIVIAVVADHLRIGLSKKSGDRR